MTWFKGASDDIEHYASAARQLGITLEEAIEQFAPEGGSDDGEDEVPPWPLEALWHAWCEMHAQRQSGGFGPSPIAWRDVLAWSELAGVELTDVERRLIMQLDQEYLRAYQQQQKDQQASKKGGDHGT